MGSRLTIKAITKRIAKT